MDNLEERIIELEIRFAHQNRLLEELNGVVAESSRRLDQLERENLRFREVLRGLAPDPTESPDE